MIARIRNGLAMLSPALGYGLDIERGGTTAFLITVDYDTAQKADSEEAHIEGARLILDLSRRFEVPVTWAVCGERADRDISLFEEVKASLGELAYHTYSHRLIPQMSSEELQEDHRRWVALVGRSPTSLVFPHNEEGMFPELVRLGFKAFRPRAHRVGIPYASQGMVAVPPVTAFGPDTDYRVLLSYVGLCRRYGAVAHFWTHPCNAKRAQTEPLFRAAADFERKTLSQFALETQDRLEARSDGVARLGG